MAWRTSTGQRIKPRKGSGPSRQMSTCTTCGKKRVRKQEYTGFPRPSYRCDVCRTEYDNRPA